MVEERDRVLDLARRFAARLEQAAIKKAQVYLYGSWAKGHAGQDSDIDLAVVSEDLPEDWNAAWLLMCELRRDLDLRIEAVPMRPEDFVDENPLAWEIMRTGLRVA